MVKGWEGRKGGKGGGTDSRKLHTHVRHSRKYSTMANSSQIDRIEN